MCVVIHLYKCYLCSCKTKTKKNVNIHTIMQCLALTPAVVVGLERTFYWVSEDVGVVEVCAVAYS